MTGFGQQGPGDANTEFGAITFLVQQMLAYVRTAVPVEVVAVTSASGVAAAGFVDVQPAVAMVDGVNDATPHGTIPGVPYVRMQGGLNAVIMDPVVGDLGFLMIADRDISAFKKNRAASPPGSYRKFDLTDGVYIGGLLNAAPEQYVRFTATGMELADKNGNKIEMKAGAILMTTTVLQVTGNIIGNFGGASVGLTTHEHPTAANGPPSPPTPGT